MIKNIFLIKLSVKEHLLK